MTLQKCRRPSRQACATHIGGWGGRAFTLGSREGIEKATPSMYARKGSSSTEIAAAAEAVTPEVGGT